MVRDHMLLCTQVRELDSQGNLAAKLGARDHSLMDTLQTTRLEVAIREVVACFGHHRSEAL
jgi:hypothetical protein